MKHFLKYKKHLLSLVLLISLLSFSAIISSAQAQGSIMQSDELKSGYKEGDYKMNDFVNIAVVAAKIIWGISGSLALLAFVVGGVMMLTSAGVAERVTKGRQAIVGGAIGLAIVFGSYAAINFIMINLLGQKDFTFTTGWFK